MIAGQAAVVTGSGTSFTAKLTVTGATPTGPVSIDISGFADAGGNIGTPVNAVTDSSIVNVDTIAPTVTISGAPGSVSGVTSFSITVTFSEPMINFVVGDITVVNGTAGTFGITSTSVYTATITPSGADDTTIDIAAAVATDLAGNGNIAAVQVVVDSTTIEDTQKVIATYMLNRANHILANQPNLISFLNGTNSPGKGELGKLSLNANEENMKLAFSSSLSKIDRETNARISKLAQNRIALAFADSGGTDNSMSIDAANTHKVFDATQTRNYDIWTEIYGARGTSEGSDSSFWLGYIGAHYILSPNLLIGALLQVDWADETNASAGSRVDGKGWMIGPYIAGRIDSSTIAYEVRVSWGKSNNNISPYGTYVDNFDTERWSTSAKINGSFAMEGLTITPSVQVSYFHEIQEEYIDSFAKVIPSQTIALGELRFGPEFSQNIRFDDGSMIQTSFGINGVWNFGVEGGTNVTGIGPGNNDFRARLDGGVTFVNALRWKLTASAYYDGLGIEVFEAIGGRLNLIIPLS